MNIQHRIEVRLCHFLQGCRADDAGVMDENVNPAAIIEVTSLVDNSVDYGYHDFTELWVRYEVRADANA